MIIQCEQCNTKFRLDDAKIKGRGVKVRCSKCRHVFLVQKEEQPGTSFGELLGQYGESGGVAFGEEAGTGLIGGTSAHIADETGGSGLSGVPGVAVTSDTHERASISASQTTTAEVPALDTTDAEAGRFDSGMLSDESGGEPKTATTPDEPAGFDIDFDFNEADQSQKPGTTPSSSVEDEFSTKIDDSFDIAPPTNVAVEPTDAEEFSIDFGELSYSTESVTDAPSMASGKTPTRDEFNLDFDDVFGEAPPLRASATSTTSVIPEDEFFPSAAAQSGKKRDDELGELDFGDLDLGELPSPTTSARETTAGVALEHEVLPRVEPAVPSQPVSITSASQDLSGENEGELPPLTISSRRKGASFFPAAITIAAIFFVVILAGIGFFVVSGPETMKKMGLGFLATLTGEAQEEGKISLGKIGAEFITNYEAGELFVIRGETVNNYSKPRASIQVKATLLGANGQPIISKSAYCGNSLTKEQLTMLSLSKLEEVMNNQFGDSLSNLGVQPGKSIPFVVVFAGVPKEAVDFGVAVTGSTVAAK